MIIEDTHMVQIFNHQVDALSLPFALHPDEESTEVEVDISDHWGEHFMKQMQDVINSHSDLFSKDIGCFKDDIKMPIPFRDEADVLSLKQNPYRLSRRD